ncbi:TetR/AcrR family transcriptional regulator [Myceligenerans indicum]|uniref:Helix-turn-helix transcriptional regulator n=1 Tax=Myceligenerans indicum TaxID=2593663 RepID=A0ABS1LLW3_9MICO|nr:TetR family transcriptional regulator [Myceligenerans indicum]MBL0886547.1 helix-turn-helix transcriptional regulator [Myceligenerans indicum]
MQVKPTRADKVAQTRERILDAAERLFAEHGLFAVSNRQISEAAGQANNSAVGYHFGTKSELIKAVVDRHVAPMELIRERLLSDIGADAGVREWVACNVRPMTDHLASLPGATWWARLVAQILTDPSLYIAELDESTASDSRRRAEEGLRHCVPDLPEDVARERERMMRTLVIYACAERERALSEGGATTRTTWEETAVGLIDAITGIWLAPVTAVAVG